MTTEIAKYELETAVLAELDAKYKDFHLDPDNADSKAMLMAGLRDYRNMRLAVVEWHKVQKADIVKIGRALDAEKARVIDLISPGENHLKAIRKAEDDRLEAIEKKRVDSIRTMINDIRNMDYRLPELNLKDMQDLKKEIESTPILEEHYMEFTGEAMACVHNVLIAINNAIEQRVKFDLEEAERKAENERLEKIRVEQEAAQKKIDAETAKIDAQMAEIKKQQNALEAEKQAEAQRKRDEEYEKQVKERAEKDAIEKIQKDLDEEAARLDAKLKEEERRASILPDKDKVLQFCDMIDALTPPRCKGEKCNIILNFGINEIYAVSNRIRKEMEEL